jgi:hypothetical protein
VDAHTQSYELEAGPDEARAQARTWWTGLRGSRHLGSVLSVLWLDAVLNLRFPNREASLWYLVPSIDLVALIGVYVVLAAARCRMPRAAQALLVLGVIAIRCLRFADGLKLRYFHREFNAYVDLPLVPELVRLLRTTLPSVEFWSLVVSAPLATVALAVSVSRALRHVERGVTEAGTRRALALVFAVFLAASPFFPQGRHAEYFSGAFGASAWPRLWQELKFTAQVPDRSGRVRSALARVHSSLPSAGRGLSRLERQNVLVFLIESYGETVLDRPSFREMSGPLLADLDRQLERAAFQRASAILESPTYGGGSWLTHATLATGVRVDNQLDYELLASLRPPTVADCFEQSGYRTVSVQPGTTREVLNNDFLGFERSYYAWSFGYRGPSFAWAPMPDQFVVDFVRRKELEAAEKPLFALFALVSSHAPWTAIPQRIDDWDSLGDGSVYHRVEPIRSSADWADLSSASPAYFASVRYDLELLTRFLIEFVKDDGLVLWLGDHQPAADVTGGSPKRGVPVHVITRRAAFLEPFLGRGYVRGLDPSRGSARLPMESLLVSLVRDFAG